MAQRRLKQNFNEVQAILDAVGQKVDKIEGKGLSANDYTDQDKDVVLLEGFVLSPCAMGPGPCRPCPEARPWYPRLPEEAWPPRRGGCPCE